MSQTCSEPLVWTCKSCGHSFHEKEWAKADRKCPACQRGAGNWKCTLCQETFNQPALSAIHPCRRVSPNAAIPPAPITLGGRGSRLLLCLTSLLAFCVIGTFSYYFLSEARESDELLKRGKSFLYGEGVIKDEMKAVDLLTKASQKGDPESQYLLGLCYGNGTGVTQDYKEAVKWYKKAADQGDARGQFGLGWSYYEGKGVTQDYKEAVKWFTKAAEQGNGFAQFNLGLCYDNGTGVTQDHKEAVKLYKKAADQGVAEAREWIRQNNL